MKLKITAALVLSASPLVAQQTGISHPPESVIEDQPLRVTKPSAAIPVSTPAEEVYQPYRPSATLHTHAEATETPIDPDAEIVTSVRRRPNELPAGTALRMRLHDEIATDATQENTPFRADLSENVESDGRVVLPAGSMVEGVITQVRGGKRIRGTALIHLQAQAVVLPDGTRMPLHAAVIDTDQYANTRVDEEGNIRRKDHVGAILAAMSLTTGGAAAAGAVLGGGVGAIVGAGVGAGVSTAWWLKQDRQAHLPKDALIVLGLTEPLLIRPLVREPEFSAGPPTYPAAAVSSATPYRAPEAIPAYIPQQSFVPTN